MSVERDYGWMWLESVERAEQAERLQRRFVRYLGPEDGVVSWEPPLDILETDAGLVLRFALPGVAAEDIEIRLEAAELTVSASRPPCPLRRALIRRLEIPHGRFVRRVALAAPLRIAESQYRNGCLELRLVANESAA